MGTLVCFHAHPDDEAIQTGGALARAHAEGHRAILVVATDGALGEVPGDLAPDETLVARRQRELAASARALGVDRVVELGYRDSGMIGWDDNSHPDAFCRADIDTAAQRLADVLIEERADVVTIYDWHGNYGHPDHVQVHVVGKRAAEIAGAELPDLRVAEATMNRDELRRGLKLAVEMGSSEIADQFDVDAPMDDGNPMGTPEAEITLCVDVSDFVGQKREAIAAHASQESDSRFFLDMSEDEFARLAAREWYIEHDRPPGPRDGWFFD